MPVCGARRNRHLSKIKPALYLLIVAVTHLVMAANASTSLKPEFDVSLPQSARRDTATGRVLLFISRVKEPEPRFQWNPEMLGVNVDQMRPNKAVVIDDTVEGYPLGSLNDLSPGDYYVQALLNVYTEFHRAEGHTIWAHMDQWEGQDLSRSPGNLYSPMQKVHLDKSQNYKINLSLTEVIPPVAVPLDTQWVKRIKIRSKLLSKFWGRPIYLGAVVLLPKGYDDNSDLCYPVVYQQGHFSEDPAFSFATQPSTESEEWHRRRLSLGFETGYEFYQAWNADRFPRMIAVTFQHPTPFYDDSYAVNSANEGPYGDAIMTELIPYIEEHFRIIREPYARLLTGGSTGGWEALALQLLHPDFFGGAWIMCPDPIDFRRYALVNIYEDDNAFVESLEDPHSQQQNEWSEAERSYLRADDGQVVFTVRQVSRAEAVLGDHDRSGGQLGIWEAAYGPVGEDGYPKELWDKRSGRIDHDVSNYMRDHDYDLRYFAEKNWPKIGPALVGKLHFYCGDMDNHYLNLATYLFEDFAKDTKEPYYRGTFEYGRPNKGHGWQPVTNAELIKIMADYIVKNVPPGSSMAWRSN
jgi:hypothetical protein